MAGKTNPKELGDLAGGLQSVMTKVDALVSHMADTFGVVGDKVKNTTSSVRSWRDQLESLQNLNKSYVQTLEDGLKTARAKELATKSGLDTEVATLILAKQQGLAAAIREGASLKELHTLKEQYDEAIKFTKERVEQEKIRDRELKIAEKINEIEDGRFKALDGINAKMGVMKDILTDQRVAAAYAFSQINKGYKEVSHMIGEVRAEGHTITQAFQETGLAISDAFSLTGTSAKDSLEVMKGMRSEMGSVHHVTREARLEAASLAKTFGVSNEEAGKLTAQFATMPGATMESANNSLEFAGNLAKAAGVAPGEVMKDIANSSEDVAAFSKDGGQNIAAAAVAAKKLGMEFGTMTKMADKLLDFENSINSQMEASVLLGREINLDKAREAAMNGDLVGMTQEMLANVGGEAEFNRMNYQQRKALAESMGVSVTDLGKMVKHQDELKNLTQEQQEALAAGELTMDEALANAGGLADKMWESTKTVGSLVIGFGEVTKGIKGAYSEAKSLFGGFKNFREGMKGGGGLKGGLKGALGMDKTPEVKTDAIDKANKVKGGGGFKKAMQEVAAGLKALGNPKVLFGIMNLALFAPAAVLGVLALPFLALIAALGTFIGVGLKGLAQGLSALANPAVAIGIGLLSLLVISVGAGMMMFGIGVGIAAAGMSLLVKAIGEIPIQNLLLMPIALGGIAVAMGLLAVASLMAAPGLLLSSYALAVMTVPLAVLSLIAQTGSITLLGEGLKMMSEAGAGLSQVAVAMLGIGSGLGLMAVAGFAAMPVIGSLIALAAVAPMLVGLGAALGGMFGGDGGGEDEDKMDTLIGKIDQLIAVASSGGEVKMDGKKVGEVIRLGLNSAGVR